MERPSHPSQAQNASPYGAVCQSGVNGSSFLLTSTPRSAARPSPFDPSMPSFHPRSESQTYNTQPHERFASNSELDRIEREIAGFNTEHRFDIIRLEEDARKSNSNLNDLMTVLQNDFSTVGAKLEESSVAVQEMNARIAAADEERKLMRSFMITRTLAEAESLELQARRLREGVHQIGGPQTGGTQSMLQITLATPTYDQSEVKSFMEASTQASSSGAAHEAATPRSSSVITAGPSARHTSETASTIRAGSVGPRAHSTPATSTTKTPVAEAVGKWLPHAVAELTPLNIPFINQETFTWEEIYQSLGGAQHSPSLYFTRNGSEDRILQGRTYWLLEAQFEPFVPTTPGHHGAKLTAFFNDKPTDDGDFVGEEDYINVPVFVCLAEGQGYTYLGQYSQKRFSDKLSHSEVHQHVPVSVLKYWAEVLADPQRPAWVTEQLISHFWPAPTYEGPNPSDSAVTTPGSGVSQPQDVETVLEKRVQRALEKFAGQLKEWKKATRIKASLLSEQAIMETWYKSDMDEEKGLRLWLEYLECVGFDGDFYGKLVALKNGKLDKGKAPLRKQKPAPENRPAVAFDAGDETPQPNLSGHQSSAIQGSPEDGDAAKDANLKRTKHPVNIKVVSPPAAEHNGSASQAVRSEQRDTPQVKSTQAASSKTNPFSGADLQAVREMHDQATKAGEKRGKAGKPAPLPRKIKW